jgi:hypothetical protein
MVESLFLRVDLFPELAREKREKRKWTFIIAQQRVSGSILYKSIHLFADMLNANIPYESSSSTTG